MSSSNGSNINMADTGMFRPAPPPRFLPEKCRSSDQQIHLYSNDDVFREQQDHDEYDPYEIEGECLEESLNITLTAPPENL